MPVPTAKNQPFTWPEEKRCAVSLSFDDARPSAIDVGVPLLDQFGVKATFYVVANNVEKRLDAWRAAAAAGHEMGNHTLTHPCSGNFAFIANRGNALESYTLERMERELTGASDEIERLLHVRPRTFAYPCGQTFVGRGREQQSYVPLVARHFEVGRGFANECAADPSFCDLAAVPSISCDGASWPDVKAMIDRAAEAGSWLVLTGHEIATEPAYHVTTTDMLGALCRYCAEPANAIWLDTVAAVGAHVRQQRS